MQINHNTLLTNLAIVHSIVFACCDFIAQSILVRITDNVYHSLQYSSKSLQIYRCWIVWGHNTRVVVVPSILAIGFLGQSTRYLHLLIPADFSKLPLVSWMVCTSGFALAHQYVFYVGFMTGLAISITVNAMMTALIVFKILKVFRQVKTTSNDQILGITGGSTLRRIIFVLIESGFALLFIQVFRIVTNVVNTEAVRNAYPIIFSIHDAFNVIIQLIHCCYFIY